MRLTFIILFIVFLFAQPVHAEQPLAAPAPSQGSHIVSKVKPLECPQCGLWQLSRSDPDGLGGDIIYIDDHKVVIPACGVFDYKMEKSKAVAIREDRYKYNLSLSLTQRKKSILCSQDKCNSWKMDIIVEGHFQEGGTADFILWKNNSEKPTLELRGWNINREDPCNSGSGSGTTACLMIENALIYKVLAIEAEHAYQQLLQNKPLSTIPSFNVALFSTAVLDFCIKKEKNSGEGSWPEAWCSACQNRILKAKLQEFAVYKACIEKNDKSHNCKFPTEGFDKSLIEEQ